MVYTLELKPKEHWGYYGSLIGLATGGGALLGNLVGAIIRQLLNEDQLEQYGWRIAFWTGTLILPVTALFIASEWNTTPTSMSTTPALLIKSPSTLCESLFGLRTGPQSYPRFLCRCLAVRAIISPLFGWYVDDSGAV